MEELKGERSKVKGERDENVEEEIIGDVIQNLEKITLHGKRADAIVKGMLEHSKRGSGQKEPTDLNALADDFLRMTYPIILAKDPISKSNYRQTWILIFRRFRSFLRTLARSCSIFIVMLSTPVLPPQPPEGGSNLYSNRNRFDILFPPFRGGKGGWG